nr:vesicle-associated protein 2-1 isoform X1 [Elaeis guineensis]
MSDRLPVKRGQAVLTRPFRPRNKLQATQILFLVSLSSTDPPVSSFHNPELLDLVAATMSGGGQLISVYPEELTFEFELDKPSYCNLKVVNNTEHHVAFKVKTTSPKRYFVRPNTSVIQPWDSCTITVTLQPQNEYPPDMQCKDKFLFQSTKVPPSTDMDELPPDTFSKDGDKVIEELKLRVVYMASSQSSHGNSEEDSGLTSSTSLKWDSDNLSMLKNSSIEEIQAVQHLKEERDAILQQNQQLQRELVILKRRRNRKSDAGFSLTFTAFAGLVGLMVGVILNFMFSSPPTA